MQREPLVWFDQILPFRRKGGARVELPIAALTDAHDRDDPIIAVETGHWFTDTGFFFLMRDLLQIAVPPRDEEAWVERLIEAPAPGVLREQLAPYGDAFDLVHPELPAMQVRPTEAARTAGSRAKPTGRAMKASDGGDEEDDEPDGAQALARLFPDAPTRNNDDKGTSFFARLDPEAAPPLAAGVVLPLLYANMVLFPSGGGGHYGLPTGLDTIKFAVTGDTLWRSLWANVQPGEPAAPDGATLPWRDPCWRDRQTAKDSWFQEHRLRLAGRPHIPMPRRYLLGRERRAVCAATGLHGLCFEAFERWPHGPSYEREGFQPSWSSAKEKLDEKSPIGTYDYRRAKGPLRFDDWLEVSLGHGTKEGNKPGWGVPDAVQRFMSAVDSVVDAFERRGLLGSAPGSTLALELSFKVRALAIVVGGKTPAASSVRELPVWRLPAGMRAEIPDTVVLVLQEVAQIAKLLADAAKRCVKLAEGMAGAEVATALEDALKAVMDEAIVDLPRRLVEAKDQVQAVAIRESAVTDAIEAAKRLFDASFPITGVDRASLAAAQARQELMAKLARLDVRRRKGQEGRAELA